MIYWGLPAEEARSARSHLSTLQPRWAVAWSDTRTRGRHLQLGLCSTSHFRYRKWHDFRLSISLVELFNWYSSNWGQWFRFYSCWEHETSHGRRSLSYCLAMLWLLEMHLGPGSQERMLCWGAVHRLAWLKNCGPTLTTKKICGFQVFKMSLIPHTQIKPDHLKIRCYWFSTNLNPPW